MQQLEAKKVWIRKTVSQ